MDHLDKLKIRLEKTTKHLISGLRASDEDKQAWLSNALMELIGENDYVQAFAKFEWELPSDYLLRISRKDNGSS